jgi:hypothetical protein
MKWVCAVFLAGMTLTQSAPGQTFELQLRDGATVALDPSTCPNQVCAPTPWGGLVSARTGSAEDGTYGVDSGVSLQSLVSDLPLNFFIVAGGDEGFPFLRGIALLNGEVLGIQENISTPGPDILTAVHEPEAFAIMLGGLALFLAARRRSRAGESRSRLRLDPSPQRLRSLVHEEREDSD